MCKFSWAATTTGPCLRRGPETAPGKGCRKEQPFLRVDLEAAPRDYGELRQTTDAASLTAVDCGRCAATERFCPVPAASGVAESTRRGFCASSAVAGPSPLARRRLAARARRGLPFAPRFALRPTRAPSPRSRSSPGPQGGSDATPGVMQPRRGGRPSTGTPETRLTTRAHLRPLLANRRTPPSDRP